jgi:hypothetical protein
MAVRARLDVSAFDRGATTSHTMTADPHWQHVKELFGAALNVEPGNRAAFVRDACRGDDGLRSEVDSLLANHEKAAGFAELPALETSTDSVLRPGDVFGPYAIRGILGVGGMGEVYRGHDSRLQREVALKVLPIIFASDPERVARFEREAQVLASLNHPNIAHLYGSKRRRVSEPLFWSWSKVRRWPIELHRVPSRSRMPCRWRGRLRKLSTRPTIRGSFTGI